jgi:dienelactone hydrolase
VLLRRRLLAWGLFGLVAAAVGVIVAVAGGGGGPAKQRQARGPASSPKRTVATVPTGAKSPPAGFAVGLRVMRLVDRSRTITPPGQPAAPRTLVTYVRYPALGAAPQTDLANAPAASASGPFPLIVFGHGFDVTPKLYQRLLQSWARAGFIIAAPAFPLENANAPGGPDESDLTNQPADMRFVISSLLAASRAAAGPLSGLVEPASIAVAGQSDGGDTALAVAYDSRFRDPRVRAAVILSGAEIPATGSFTFEPGSPPLLATQGTADTVNPPALTSAFFHSAQRPKYLLSLLGAEHLPPYSVQQPQLGIVERVTIAFLDGYLKHSSTELGHLASLGSVSGVASLQAEP